MVFRKVLISNIGQCIWKINCKRKFCQYYLQTVTCMFFFNGQDLATWNAISGGLFPATTVPWQ